MGAEIETPAQPREAGSIVTVEGELDAASAPRLGVQLHRLADQGHASLTLDCTRLDFIDSQGLGVLVGVSRRLRDAGGNLHLRGAASQVVRVLRLTRLDEVFVLEEGGAG